MEEAKELTRRRLAVWDQYHAALTPLEKAGILRRPVIPAECRQNAHMYYILLPDQQTRTWLIRRLNKQGINAIFHYVPLHSSPAGKKYGRVHGELKVTEGLAECIVRLPMWIGLTQSHIEQIAFTVESLLQRDKKIN